MTSSMSSRDQIMKSLEGPQCELCFSSRLKTNMFFAKCKTHNGICYKCGQMYMLECINKGKMPVCFHECGQEMCTDSISLFQYFSTSSQEKWKIKQPELRRQANIDQNHKLRKPCKVPDCSGIIRNNRCPICGKTYCQHCGQFDHDPTQKCEKNRRELVEIFEDAKKCPKCSLVFIREAGCMKIRCPNCHHEFCYCCLQNWTNQHHASHGVKGICEMICGFFYECCCCGKKENAYQE